MTDEIRIVTAENHPFFRDGLRVALAGVEWFRIVGEAGDGQTALEYVQTLDPDVVRTEKDSSSALVPAPVFTVHPRSTSSTGSGGLPPRAEARTISRS